MKSENLQKLIVWGISLLKASPHYEMMRQIIPADIRAQEFKYGH